MIVDNLPPDADAINMMRKLSSGQLGQIWKQLKDAVRNNKHENELKGKKKK